MHEREYVAYAAYPPEFNRPMAQQNLLHLLKSCVLDFLLLSQAETKEIFHAVIAAEAASAAAVVQEGRNTEDDIVTDDEDETVAFDAWCQREMERLR